MTAVLALGAFIVLFAEDASWAAAPLLPLRPAATANGEPGNAGVRAGSAGLGADIGGPDDVLVGFTIYS